MNKVIVTNYSLSLEVIPHDRCVKCVVSFDDGNLKRIFCPWTISRM